MNGILKLDFKTSDKENQSEEKKLSLETVKKKEHWSVEDVLPLIFPQGKVNPYKNQLLNDQVVSKMPPKNDDIDKITKQLETLIKVRKC